MQIAYDRMQAAYDRMQGVDAWKTPVPRSNLFIFMTNLSLIDLSGGWEGSGGKKNCQQ